MHPSSASADYISDAFLRLCFGRAVFCCLFSGELGGTTSRVSGTAQCTSVQQVQRRRPQPAAETGRSCWGRGQQDTSTAQGAKWMLGAATRRNFSYGSASAGPFFCCPGSTERSIQQSAPTPVLERGRFVCEGLQPEGCMRNRRLGHISQSVPAQSVRRCKAGRHRFVKGGKARLSALRFCRSGWRTRQ